MQMYSDKENVNILTALLVAHGVRHAVVCPGSRNAPIVHNLNRCSEVKCYPVTDERSAGFYALGMAQALGERVVVCVTSGTALLNLAPAVAEAYYQQLPIVVVSADRPQQWIDQLDGQTIPQADALGRFVRRSVSLPEPSTAETRWYCNRLVNEALLEQHAPVHINVPISEPLFHFTTASLPRERTILLETPEPSDAAIDTITERFFAAERPMLVCGQPMNAHLDEAVCLVGDDEDYTPDFVLYAGGSIVSKRLKHFLRKADECWRLTTTVEVSDTFMNLSRLWIVQPQAVVDRIRLRLAQEPHPFILKWQRLIDRIAQHATDYEPAFSQMLAVKRFEQSLPNDCRCHYANSQAIRLANIYAQHSVCCNRGVNGIEGSLSTAGGCSLVSEVPTFCVVGDLSFFYDQNALWNQNLDGRLRILLLNNGEGGIFRLLPGLSESDASKRLVAAAHTTTAEGICRENRVDYLHANDEDELMQGLDTLLNKTSERPMLLEVFTNADSDAETYCNYYHSLDELTDGDKPQ